MWGWQHWQRGTSTLPRPLPNSRRPIPTPTRRAMEDASIHRAAVARGPAAQLVAERLTITVVGPAASEGSDCKSAG